MTCEELLMELVRSWVEDALPGDTEAAEDAAAVALRAYAGGASVSEACAEARRLVVSWSRHPSQGGAVRPLLRLVS